MQKEPCQNFQPFSYNVFQRKMGVALPSSSGRFNIAENNSENFIDHKLIDAIAEGILKNTRATPKKWVWPCHAPQGGQNCWKKSEIFYWS